MLLSDPDERDERIEREERREKDRCLSLFVHMHMSIRVFGYVETSFYSLWLRASHSQVCIKMCRVCHVRER